MFYDTYGKWGSYIPQTVRMIQIFASGMHLTH